MDAHNLLNHSATGCNRAGTVQCGPTRCNAVQVGLQNITDKFSPVPPTEKCETALLTACESAQVPACPQGPSGRSVSAPIAAALTRLGWQGNATQCQQCLKQNFLRLTLAG